MLLQAVNFTGYRLIRRTLPLRYGQKGNKNVRLVEMENTVASFTTHLTTNQVVAILHEY